MAITKDELDRYIRAYMEGNPLISDEEYDRLLEEYLKENGEDKRPYLRQKQSGVINGLVGTLPKVYGVREPMREGQDTYEKWFHRKGINPNAKIIIQPKFDGASIAFDKSGRFFTRGDYQNGESVDVTDLFKNHNVSKYMKESTDGVKFEAIMSHENFYSAGIDELGSYLKPLDVVNAIIHSRNDKVSNYITLIPLRESVGGDEYVCSELQTVSLVTSTADDFETIQQFIVDKLNDGATVEYGGRHYSIDGVVVSVLGPDNETQEEIAIKILNDINETKLVDVVFQFGKTGKITPVAIVEPVQFCDGKRTVDHITVSTLDRVNEMNLRKGDTVRVMYNIVPYLLDSAQDGYERIQLPTHCPKCGAPFEYTSLKTVRCTNPVCQGRKLGSIIRYCEKMKMMGLGESTITTLFDEGFIKEIDDLYTLTVEDITSLPGFKETSATNILKAIHDNSQDVPVCRWLGALPFLDVDSKKWELLITSVLGNDEMYRSNVIRHIFQEAPDEFDTLLVQNVRGIGTATIKAMNEGFIANKEMFKRLIKFITFKSTTNVSNRGRVCLTGTRDKTVIDYLTKKGYQVTDSLTKDTVLVVRPDPMFESGKTKKAYDLGIKIITINEALGL
jgi:DNA ligase (NAD+)